MKGYLINMYLLVPRSKSSAKVKVKYKGYISKKNGRFGGIRVSQTHLVFSELCPFFDFLSSVKRPTSECWYPYAVLLFNITVRVYSACKML